MIYEFIFELCVSCLWYSDISLMCGHPLPDGFSLMRKHPLPNGISLLRGHPLPIGISLEGKPKHLAMETTSKNAKTTVFPRGKIRDGCLRCWNKVMRPEKFTHAQTPFAYRHFPQGKTKTSSYGDYIKKCQNYRLPLREDKRWVFAMFD